MMLGQLTALTGVILACGALWLRRGLLIAEVSGASMLPSYRSGDRLLAVRRRPGGPLRAGQVILMRHPGPTVKNRWLVKRVAAVAGEPVPSDFKSDAISKEQTILPGDTVPEGHALILGDNQAHSMDSRQLGFVSLNDLVAVVTRRIN
ncbi:S26 family signal peptidase [Streptosporangium sp. NPDC023615]|uniref:S26 family signal peptidase n=1 Tax=Streptosporangium sp. NPDC023615 TaxID=3154794 RepID=UPI00342B3E4F